jgi:broad specificity phosphatase PhoE
MIIYIVRHPETEHNKKGIIQGHADSLLTDRGKKVADKLGKLLKSKDINKIFSSDLGRCMQTSKIIKKRLKLNITPIKELRELNYGDFNGEKNSIIREKFPLNNPNLILPNGESFNQMKKRIWIFIKHLKEKKPVLLVTHEGCLRAIISQVLKVKFTSNKCKTEPNQIFMLDTTKKRITIVN